MSPMNIQDAIAEPMTDCFTTIPDYSPSASVPNQIRLDEMNSQLGALQGKELYYAELSLDPQFDGIDSGNDLVFNHILWFAAKGNIPYPEGSSIIADDDD